jgi:tetratricopeptide (TPR) repeat protein
VIEKRVRQFLPFLMGSLHQQQAEGELVLEQNDGVRRFYWSHGELIYLRSDSVGEQFGNFLIRRGVLDVAALKEVLEDGEGARVGDRVVQWGLMTVEERDAQLHELLESVLLHALEHSILKATWIPESLNQSLSGDLQFHLDHRRLVWDTFHAAKIDLELVTMFNSQPDWRWKARPDLLESVSDLPLTPSLAYALSLLGTDALGWTMIGSLSGLPEIQAARLLATLWALGGLSLAVGDLPLVPKEEPPPPPPPPEPETEPEPALEAIDIVLEDSAPPGVLQPISLDLPLQGLALDMPEWDQAPALPHAPVEEPPSTEPTPMERAHHLLIKAKSYIMQDRTSEAIRALEQSIKLDGDSQAAYEAWLMLGRLRITNPAWSTRAIEALQVASRLKPNAAEPWALMGELYHRKGFKANAQGCLRRALELDPSVAIPAGWSSDASLEPSARDSQGGGSGFMGRLKSILGREKG